MLLWVISIGIGILFGIQEEDIKKQQKDKEDYLQSIINYQNKQIDELIDICNYYKEAK